MLTAFHQKSSSIKAEDINFIENSTLLSFHTSSFLIPNLYQIVRFVNDDFFL